MAKIEQHECQEKDKGGRYSRLPRVRQYLRPGEKCPRCGHINKVKKGEG